MYVSRKKILIDRLSNTRGSAVMGLMLAGLITASTLSLTFLINSKRYELSNVNQKLSLTILKNNFYSVLKNEEAWAKTVSVNKDMSCITSTKEKCHSMTKKVNKINDIRTASGNVFFDSTTKNSGFTKNGALCNTFSEKKGDPNCPFRYELSWEPVNNTVKVSAKLIHNNGGSGMLNTSNYNLVITR